MANKKIKRNYSSKKKYSASERKSYKKGFFAGLFARKKKNDAKQPKNKHGKTLSDYPNWGKHNVLFDDADYKRFYYGALDMGFEHEKARDIALSIYSKEYNDRKLKEHYGIK